MHALTVYTPTYNRAHLLPRLYESLCHQTCKRFIWMVIDDGSTDNTKELIAAWTSEGKLEIEYHHKENGGVHTARDMAYQLVQTELILSVDSDDYMTDDAVEVVLDCWEKSGGAAYSGIFTLNRSTLGGYCGKPFPDVKAASYQDFTYKYRWYGDKATVLRSDIIRTIPNCPVFEGEKLVGEGYKWILLPDDKPFLILNRPTHVVDYQHDGYTENARVNFFESPRGIRESHRQHIIHSKYFSPRLRAHIGYILYSIYLKDNAFVRDSPKPWVTALLLPFGLVAYWYARRKWGVNMPKK